MELHETLNLSKPTKVLLPLLLMLSILILGALVVGGHGIVSSQKNQNQFRVSLQTTNYTNVMEHLKSLNSNQQRIWPLAKIIDKNSGTFFIGRDTAKQNLRILNLSENSELKLPKKLSNSYPIHITRKNYNDLMVAYNPNNKLVPGQSLKNSTEKLDLWELDTKTGKVTKFGELEGSLTSEIVSASYKNKTLICLIGVCHEILNDKSRKLNLPNLQPIELNTQKQTAWMIAREINDDRFNDFSKGSFYICQITISNSKCRILKEYGVPRFSLKQNHNKKEPDIEFAISQPERINVFLNDLQDIFLTFGGASNSEGRLAWQAFQFIEGLSAIEKLPDLDSETVEEIHNFRKAYINWLLVELNEDVRFAYSKRYSLGRFPTLSVLHISRIMSIIEPEVAISRVNSQAYSTLRQEIVSSDNTLETFDFYDGVSVMRIKKGSAFWADGVPVPWNYQSALVEYSMRNSYKQCDFDFPKPGIISSFLKSFDKNEFEIARQNLWWNYSRGPLFDGWTKSDSISVNTESYNGDKIETTSIAHSSYRTMDARALMLAIRCGDASLKRWESLLLRAFSENRLEPSFLSSLQPDSNIPISPRSRDYWGRLTDAWQLSNAVWSLVERRNELPFDLMSDVELIHNKNK